jgi:hypothetical protein
MKNEIEIRKLIDTLSEIKSRQEIAFDILKPCFNSKDEIYRHFAAMCAHLSLFTKDIYKRITKCEIDDQFDEEVMQIMEFLKTCGCNTMKNMVCTICKKEFQFLENKDGQELICPSCYF